MLSVEFTFVRASTWSRVTLVKVVDGWVPHMIHDLGIKIAKEMGEGWELEKWKR